jgi:hypothetical protein
VRGGTQRRVKEDRGDWRRTASVGVQLRNRGGQCRVEDNSGG